MARLRIAITIVAMSLACIAQAQNLLTNPKFDDDVTGWTSAAQISWHDLDSLDSGSSGSLRLTYNAVQGGTGANAKQCVAATAGQQYTFGAKMMVPSGQPKSGAAVYVDFYASADCSGPSIRQMGTGGVSVPSNGAFTALSVHSIVANDNAHSASVTLSLYAYDAGTVNAYFDDVMFTRAGACVPDLDTVCLENGRFKVVASYWLEDQVAKSAHPVQLTSDSGYFWFFNQDNVEVMIKVLDATSVNQRHWVFAAGTTNVGVHIAVTDTLTGAYRVYSNTYNHAFQPILDTDAFN